MSLSLSLKWSVGGCLTAVALLALTPTVGSAQILDPNVLIEGKTQKELAADWGRWIATAPVGSDPLSPTNSLHPIMEVTGSQGFRGIASGMPNVFFIGGSFAQITGFSTVHRTISVPIGYTLFFPLLSAGPLDNTAPFGSPPTTLTPDEFLNGKAGTDYTVNHIASLNAATLFAEVDGVSASDLGSHRQTNGGAGFDVIYTDTDNLNSVFGYDVTLGTGILPSSVLSASDGYFVAVAPLSAGVHTLHFGGFEEFIDVGGNSVGNFSQDITYTITVGAPEPASALLVLPVAGIFLRRRYTRRVTGSAV